MRRLFSGLALAASVFIATAASAQQSERFGPYELFFSVVNTTFLEPEVAAQYGITRGDKRGILNLAVREVADDGSSEARAMELDGRSWDLITGHDLVFKEVREGPAIYYIAEFKFINREWRWFEFDFTPAGSDETFHYKFKHQLYIN
jgi:hypothetical protein